MLASVSCAAEFTQKFLLSKLTLDGAQGLERDVGLLLVRDVCGFRDGYPAAVDGGVVGVLGLAIGYLDDAVLGAREAVEACAAGRVEGYHGEVGGREMIPQVGTVGGELYGCDGAGCGLEELGCFGEEGGGPATACQEGGGWLDWGGEGRGVGGSLQATMTLSA